MEGQNFNFQDFEDKVKQIIKHKSLRLYYQSIQEFSQGQISHLDVFEDFREIFGDKLCFKYYYLFSVTTNNPELVKEMYKVLLKNLKRVKFKGKCILSTVKKYGGVIQKIFEEISTNILVRIESERFDLKKRYKMNSNRIF